MTDCPTCDVPTNNLDVCNSCRSYQLPATVTLDVVDPSWLIATGDGQRVEVLRSPLVESTDADYAPVARFITDHGLVLAAQQTYTDDRWIFGAFEFSVFTSPAARNTAYVTLGAR